MASRPLRRGTSPIVGLYSDASTVWGCCTTTTLVGTLRHEFAHEPIQDDWNAAVEQLLKKLQVMPESAWVTVGVPHRDCYFVTRPAGTAAATAAPKTLLRESLRCSTHGLNRLTTDVIHWQPDRRPVVGIAACQTDLVTRYSEFLAETKLRFHRVEPLSCAILRAAANADKGTRPTDLVIRVILGSNEMLVALCCGSRPIACEEVDIPPGDETVGFLAAIREIQSLGESCGLTRQAQSVVIHGRTELRSLVDMPWLREQLGMEVHWQAGPELSANEFTKALTIDLIRTDEEAFDFVRGQHEAPSLLSLFSWRQASYCAAAVLLVASWLQFTAWEQAASYQNQLTTVPVEVASGKNFANEKTQLVTRTASFNQFADGRIIWHQVLQELSAILPSEIRLTSFRGESPISESGKIGTAQRSTMVLRGMVNLSAQGTVPPELSRFVNELRGIQDLNRAFEKIELADVQKVDAKEGPAMASFSVICLPKESKGKSSHGK